MLKKETLNLLNSTEIDFKNVFSICIGKSYLFQKRFIDSLGNYDRWSTDVKEGLLKLDDKIFNVEYIGTTGNDDPYWYSADVERVIPENYTSLIVNSKKNMEALNFSKLVDKKIFIVDFINAYNLSMIYIAFAPENVAYFCGSGDPSIYMFVKNLPDSIFRKIEAYEFTTFVMDVISKFDVNHILLVKSILLDNSIDFVETNNSIIAKFKDSTLTINFNENDLIESISGGLN